MATYVQALIRQELESDAELAFASACEKAFTKYRQQHPRSMSIFQINRLRRDIARKLRPAFDAEVDKLVAEIAAKIEDAERAE